MSPQVTHGNSRILEGTKYSYDRQKVVRLDKVLNYNQMLGYVE